MGDGKESIIITAKGNLRLRSFYNNIFTFHLAMSIKIASTDQSNIGIPFLSSKFTEKSTSTVISFLSAKTADIPGT